MQRRVGSAIVLLATAAVAGCGDSGSTTSTSTTAAAQSSIPSAFTATTATDVGTVPENILTDAAMAKVSEGTPARAVLEWWQAVQFRDVPTVRTLTQAAVTEQVGASRLRVMVLRVGDQLPGMRIVNQRVRGTQAVVRAFLVFAGADGAPPTLSPHAFVLERVGDAWQIADIEYLKSVYDASVKTAADAKAAADTKAAREKSSTKSTTSGTQTQAP